MDGNIDEPVEDGDTALHLTCLYGHLACVQVAYYYWVFFSSPNLILLVHCLCIFVALAQLLLERGASVEAKDEDGALPLHDACAGGESETLNLNLIGKKCIFY